MSKRKITKQQQTRISKQQQKRVSSIVKSNSTDQEGLLVAHYGVSVDVENTEGKTYRCNIRQNLGVVVPGDRVVWHQSSETTGVLVALIPRRTLLSRPSAHHKIKPIAANIDQVTIVMAPEPKPAASIIDSYLVAIETLQLPAMIVCNKIDLIKDNNDRALLDQIALYQHIGYPVLLVSSRKKEGLDELMRCLHGLTTIFVGQSGVGKSSLISCLLPTSNIREVTTAASDHGTHTTTTARLYHFPSGGDLIDSPGIREFALWDLPSQEIAKGFIEFQPYLGECKYRNCQHINEPTCAILQAVRDTIISEARLASYHRIVANNTH